MTSPLSRGQRVKLRNKSPEEAPAALNKLISEFAITIVGIAGFLLLKSLWARRSALLHALLKLAIACLFGLWVYNLFSTSPAKDSAPVIGLAAGGLMLYRTLGRPPRRLKARVRRDVISKWQIETGKKFNSRFHEIDHIVPFSKGGNETEDNLRVMERKRNRSKGAKAPWWDLLDRR
jgi:hypothetical protein